MKFSVHTMRISAFNRSCERKQSHIYPSRSLKKVAISFDHDPILFSTANPADEVFGRHNQLDSVSFIRVFAHFEKTTNILVVKYLKKPFHNLPLL